MTLSYFYRKFCQFLINKGLTYDKTGIIGAGRRCRSRICRALSKFSARATATNFDEQTLDEFTAYAHSLNRKVYVALNTVLQESELPDLIKSLDVCTRCKVDGLIIQDLGVAHVMREKYPWFEMHASTQMAVHNKEGALFLKKIGFKFDNPHPEGLNIPEEFEFFYRIRETRGLGER